MPRFHAERSISINASPEKVFEAAVDYSTWSTWSPWLCAEPDARVTVSDDPSSVGSLYAWEGDLVGAGEIEHRHLEAGRLIRDEIRFSKPFKSKSEVSFVIEPEDQGARITWHMDGSLPWFLFWMRGQMENFIGMDYERGLRMLKEWIETGEVLSKTVITGAQNVGPLHVIGVRESRSLADIGSAMERAFAMAAEKLGDLPDDCAAISVYHAFDMKTRMCEYTSGFALPDSTATPAGLNSWSIPRMQALKIEHTGAYHHLGNAWSAGHQYARYKKVKLSREAGYEFYLNDPHQTPPAELRTDVFLLMR